MDAALITGMLKIGYSVSSEPAKDVLIKKDTDFKNVLSKSVNKKDTKDVKKESVKDVKEDKKDVENKNVKDEESIKEKPKNEKVDKKKEDKKVEGKDEDKNGTEEINGLVEKVLGSIDENTDVENLEELKNILSEMGIEDVSSEGLLKIQEELKNRLMGKVIEVGPQIVETEETELSKYDEIEDKLDSLAEKLGVPNEDVENKNVQSDDGEEMSDSKQESGLDFVPSDENKGILEHKEVKKESKFNITDLRKNMNVENKDSQIQPDVKNIDSEITSFDITDVNDVVMSKAEKLQEQIDVIKQVSEHIDVNLTEDRSEMVIKLKPDNLGKVTMQVSIENGNVVAKFLAESQKVKEILESNMQSLKDHLAKQGMVIQDLSVSVENDNRQQQMFESRNMRSFNRHQEADKIETGSYFGENAYEESGNNLANYWPDSTVSFSA